MSFNEFKREPGRTDNPSELKQQLKGIAAGIGNFRLIDEQFDNFPDNNAPLQFQVGSDISAPIGPDTTEKLNWKIVRAEKGHYLLEKNGLGHLVCNEQELQQWGNDPKKVSALFLESYGKMSPTEKAKLKASTLPRKYLKIIGLILSMESTQRDDAFGLSDEKFLQMNEEDLDKINQKILNPK